MGGLARLGERLSCTCLHFGPKAGHQLPTRTGTWGCLGREPAGLGIIDLEYPYLGGTYSSRLTKDATPVFLWIS